MVRSRSFGRVLKRSLDIPISVGSAIWRKGAGVALTSIRAGGSGSRLASHDATIRRRDFRRVAASWLVPCLKDYPPFTSASEAPKLM